MYQNQVIFEIFSSPVLVSKTNPVSILLAFVLLYVNLIIRAAKEPRREERKIFCAYIQQTCKRVSSAFNSQLLSTAAYALKSKFKLAEGQQIGIIFIQRKENFCLVGNTP